MRVVGIRLTDGRSVWADAGDWEVAPLDTALVQTPDGERSGSVFVVPEQLLQPPKRMDGQVVGVLPRQTTREPCDDFPGADLPCLGSLIRTRAGIGRVIAVDAVRRVVRLTQDDGSTVELSPSEIE